MAPVAGPSKLPDTIPEDELKAAIWYTCAKIVEEEEISLGVSASEGFVAALAELVFAQAETLGRDLESFSKHAKRSNVQVEDILLATRRNPTLTTLLEQEARSRGIPLPAKGTTLAKPSRPIAGAAKVEEDDSDVGMTKPSKRPKPKAQADTGSVAASKVKKKG